MFILKNIITIQFDSGKDLIKIISIYSYLVVFWRGLYFSIHLFATSVSKLKFEE